MSEQKRSVWGRLLFSETLAGKKETHKIAYIAVMTAFAVIVNMFFEFKLAETQFSFTLAASILTGILLGPIFGFTACFLGDLVGFLYNSAGFMYMPWVGISLGVAAVISGIIFNIRFEKKWAVYAKLALVCGVTFILCTVAINTTAFWLLYSKVDYGTYLIS